jgi:hypothetical protein
MSNPFRDPSLWVRTVAFSAAILGISLGLCGLNLGASFLLSPHTGGPAVAKTPLQETLGSALTFTGIVEIGGMALGAAGIALSFVGMLVQLFWRLATRRRQ